VSIRSASPPDLAYFDKFSRPQVCGSPTTPGKILVSIASSVSITAWKISSEESESNFNLKGHRLNGALD
jgi:hypothetical protein